jgi:hypothetical protein
MNNFCPYHEYIFPCPEYDSPAVKLYVYIYDSINMIE